MLSHVERCLYRPFWPGYRTGRHRPGRDACAGLSLQACRERVDQVGKRRTAWGQSNPLASLAFRSAGWL